MRMHKKIGRVVSGFLAALTLAASMPYAAATPVSRPSPW